MHNILKSLLATMVIGQERKLGMDDQYFAGVCPSMSIHTFTAPLLYYGAGFISISRIIITLFSHNI